MTETVKVVTHIDLGLGQKVDLVLIKILRPFKTKEVRITVYTCGGKFLENFFTPPIVNEWADESHRIQTRILHEKP